MRIGMVTACYKPVINGVTRMVSLYKQHLEARGHDVTIFTLGDPDPAGDEPGVVRSPAIPLGSSGYYLSMRYTRAAQELMGQMDIIHCHHLFMSAEMAHRYGRCPIVYTNHTRYDLYTGSVISLPQPAADALMRQIWPDVTDLTDMVITPAESVRKVMLEFGVRQPIVVIENGVDLEPFRSPQNPVSKAQLGIPADAILLVYVGRLSTEKNLERLLKQFAIAKELFPELHLMLVGSGPLEEELAALAKELGARQNVHLVGPVSFERVADYLAAADAFVTASVTEVHPLTVIEAMASGLPVVAVSSPGIVDTVEVCKSGLLTSHIDGGLAAAITAIAADKTRRVELGKGALAASSRFAIDSTIDRTLDLYERLQRTRPDLSREREHGKALKRRERWQPIVEQLDRLLRPGDLLGTGRLKWMVGEGEAEKGSWRDEQA